MFILCLRIGTCNPTEEFHFDFDTYPHIPTFLEIEAPSKEKIKKYVKLFGYSMKEALPWSTKELFDYYGLSP